MRIIFPHIASVIACDRFCVWSPWCNLTSALSDNRTVCCATMFLYNDDEEMNNYLRLCDKEK